MATKNDLRRRQLVVPFGTGGSYDYLNYPAITTAVDYWGIDREMQENLEIKNQRFINYINQLLRTKYEGPVSKRVTKLVQPPIAYDKFADKETQKLMGTVEVRKFPLWGICTSCSALAKSDPFNNLKQRCKNPNGLPGSRRKACANKPMGSDVEPVRFIAFCPKGHLQDLPWDELMSTNCQQGCSMASGVHNFSSPSLYLTDDGNGMGFNSLKITCGVCEGKYILRGLGQYEIYEDLVNKAGNRIFSCSGKKPWTNDEDEGCNQTLEIQPRGASKIYLPIQRSSIYVPEKEDVKHPILDEKTVQNLISEEHGEQSIKQFIEISGLDKEHKLSLEEAVDLILEELKLLKEDDLEEEEIEQSFLLKEYETLCKKEVNDPSFKSIRMDNNDYSEEVNQFFSSLHQVKKVKSSTVLLGFERSGGDSLGKGLSQRDTFNPARLNVPFLPAFEVSGEGFFLNFGYEKIKNWLDLNPNFINRGRILKKNSESDFMKDNYKDTNFHPGFFMLHSFSHALMRQLSIECGYGLTEMQERIYFDDKTKMSGVFIYTASSDAEGSLGGLVRMIKPYYFEGLLRNSIENSRLCSNDPICYESQGQGHAGLDLSACHACSMIPDLACSTLPKNIFLDRVSIIGDEEKELGYFSSL